MIVVFQDVCLTFTDDVDGDTIDKVDVVEKVTRSLRKLYGMR